MLTLAQVLCAHPITGTCCSNHPRYCVLSPSKYSVLPRSYVLRADPIPCSPFLHPFAGHGQLHLCSRSRWNTDLEGTGASLLSPHSVPTIHTIHLPPWPPYLIPQSISSLCTHSIAIPPHFQSLAFFLCPSSLLSSLPLSFRPTAPLSHRLPRPSFPPHTLITSRLLAYRIDRSSSC